jgi:ADP-heptose:LPS heptosyltransferase
MSLAAIFQTTLESIPANIPYLNADIAMAAQRDNALPRASTTYPRIGIAWAGNPNYRVDHERSTTLETLLPLLELPNIHWFSLQKDATSQINSLPSHIDLQDASSSDRDLADTAALIHNLDLVITTDTVIAHLAGALGKPLWLLLPWQSDWRWMQLRTDTPWYPTARLFRQSSLNNWTELIAPVTDSLAAFLSDPSSRSSL